MASSLRERILGLVGGTDPALLGSLLRRSLGGKKLALCFHRTGVRREGELLPKLTSPSADIDALLDLLLRGAGRRDRWLTISFDDGYREAAEYVLDRAPRFPEVEWLFFVCPQKIERGVGFRWDLAEVRRRADPTFSLDAELAAPIDLSAENLRADLVDLASRPEFALADVETCRAIQRLPNAALGNHTNVHQRPALLTPEQFRREMDESFADFARLFGPARHFAFPFGVPDEDFASEHVAVLRELGAFHIWSTQPRPYLDAEREIGVALPRFAIDGSRSVGATAAHIAFQCLRPRRGSHRLGGALWPAGARAGLEEALP